MPQPKSSSSRASGGGKKRSAASSKSASKRSSSAASSRSGSSSKSGSTSGSSRRAASSSGSSRAKSTRRSGSASSGSSRRGSSSRGRTASAGGRSGGAAGRGAPQLDDNLGATLNSLRDLLSRGVVLSAERLQETLEDAVRRGRMTRSDAEELLTSLVTSGRKQTEEVLSDIEAVLGRTRDRVRTQARRAAAPGSDRVLREVDRARRAVGIGPSFPILGYDDLAAGQIVARLEDLNSAQLRKVRDYERRHGNRKSVLDAIERNLA